jgi:ketosteroid isomerase-like protein
VATQRAVDEADIRRQLGTLIEAIRAMDLERLKPIYASGIVSFDVGPPLQRVGVEGKCRNWEEAFTVFQPPIGFEIRDLTITSGGDVAFGHGFNRLSGTLKNGSVSSGVWVRATFCLRKIDGEWLIVHDHASVPLDFASGRPVMNLEP